jgi:transcriptional regulator with XRE-family HTH domain
MGQSFGMLLKEWRGRAGKSMGDVARYVGVSVTYISDVEREVRAPLSPDKIKKVASFLNIPPVQTEELLRAAATSRGAFEVNAGITEKHDHVGAVLMRGWDSLSPEQLDRIEQIVGASRRSKTGERPAVTMEEQN